MQRTKKHTVLSEGPVSPSFIARSIEDHSRKTFIGAHSIFLGQVRSDIVDGRSVAAIEYTAYREMAEEKFQEIRRDAFDNFQLSCLHIHHSLGTVKAGEISLMVFTAAVHRRDAIAACQTIVERIKKEVPVWGKEIFENKTTQWKVNT